MVLLEKTCRYCGLIFLHDDGNDNINVKNNPLRREAYCPRCIDPNAIRSLSYEKEDIICIFKEYLISNAISIEELDKDEILSMMREFPRLYSLYHSNSTYRTFTLQIGERFVGVDGDFELGSINFTTVASDGVYAVNREIKCLRCATVAHYPKFMALKFFIGMPLKYCKTCDNWKRNTNGLMKGREVDKNSERSLAKALNCSRMDFRRNRPKKPVSALDIGTVVGSFRILSTYWDENPNTLAPRYLIECVKCGQQSRIAQKKIYDQVHYCVAVKKLVK